MPLGDLVYGDASAQDFASCYQPSWGRHFGRTRPVPGNHDYEMPGAAGYFGYFGAIAGDPGSGYYSYDVGAWHVVALNSGDCDVVACNATSAQVQWLRADLAAHPRTCTLAVWHHPRFNSGTSHGNRGGMRYFWNALYEYGADVILNAHEHVYERFGPQDPSAAPDPARGIRQFTVGTGGASPSSFADVAQPNSEVRIAGIYGVLRLDLRATSYHWEFVGTDGAVRDAGEQGCH